MECYEVGEDENMSSQDILSRVKWPKKHARVMVDPKKQHNLIGVWQTPRIGLGSVPLAYRLLLILLASLRSQQRVPLS